MTNLRNSIEKNLPFISVFTYGSNEYVGIIDNQDQYVTCFYDFNALKSQEERELFLSIGETWWWESNRQFPISIFCRDQINLFKYIFKTFNSKDVTILMGPVVNVTKLLDKRIKRRSIQVLRRP